MQFKWNWIIRYWEAVTMRKLGLRSYIRSWYRTVYRIQSFWHRKLPAHARSDPWPLLKQNVISPDMSSTLCATVSLSFLPALSCCPSPVILERHQWQITPAEPSRLSSWAPKLWTVCHTVCRELKTQHGNSTMIWAFPLFFPFFFCWKHSFNVSSFFWR